MNERVAQALEQLNVADHVDNKTQAPLRHYRELFAAADPKQLSARSGVFYDEENCVFTLPILGASVDVLWPEMDAVMSASGRSVPHSMQILAARLILEGALAAGSGEFLAYSQVPWGDTYVDAFDHRCTNILAAAFDSARDFSASCEHFGFEAIEGADAAYEAQFMPGLYVRIMYWEADEEFPAAVKVLFSDNFPLAFSAEDMAVVGDIFAGLLA